MSKKKAPAKRGERSPSDVTLRLIGYEWSTFRRKLAEAIDAHELNKDELAAKAGVAPSMLTRLPVNMAWWSAVALARALGRPMGELLGEKPGGDGGQRPRISVSHGFVDDDESRPKSEKPLANEHRAARKARK